MFSFSSKWFSWLYASLSWNFSKWRKHRNGTVIATVCHSTSLKDGVNFEDLEDIRDNTWFNWFNVNYIWNNSYLNCGCRWKWRMIIATEHVWLHGSVGRASHRYRGGHGFESRWSPDFFRLLLSSCLNWKLTAMFILHFHQLIQ